MSLRPSRKHSDTISNGSPTMSPRNQRLQSAYRDDDDDASGKNKAFISNKAMGLAFSAVLLLTVAVNYHASSHGRAAGSSPSATKVRPVIPYKTIDEHMEDKGDRRMSNMRSKVALSPHEDEALERNAKDGVRSHLVFSTDCSSYQHWQSYLVYYSALKVKQPGHVTRIVSGCNEEESKEITTWFETHVQHMSKRFHIHLTPHFSSVSGGGDYKFFNKPFGLRHWLEHSPQVEMNSATLASPHENDLVILIDPDMVLLRPIAGDFSNPNETVLGPRKKRKPPFESMVVQHGKPFAQSYGLGSQWMKFDLDTIAGPSSPAKRVVREEAGVWYPAGPPYIATLRDMHQIAMKWTEFVPKVHHDYPHLLAEMFAYCVAAAHLQLPHKLVDSLMVSNIAVGGEGWPLVDEIANDEVCLVASNPTTAKKPLPSVVHSCQRYAVGDAWFFGKRRVPHDIFSCQHPLLREPPSNLATVFDYKKPPGQREKKPLSETEAKREAFMVCSMTSLLNEASIFYKQHYCKGDANLSKTFTLGQADSPKKVGIGNKDKK